MGALLGYAFIGTLIVNMLTSHLTILFIFYYFFLSLTDGLNLDGTVSVENNARLGTPDSKNGTVIQGYAYAQDPSEPGKLSVVFPSVPGPPGECKLTMTKIILRSDSRVVSNMIYQSTLNRKPSC